MYFVNSSLLHSSFILYIVKKKQQIHPRLFTKLIINKNKVTLFYKDNKFNETGERVINKKIEKIVNNINCTKSQLVKKNEIEYHSLIRYIKIQKKVLEKHQKVRNYESCKIVESSILLMQEFKTDFEKWFKNNIILS
mgnify:CR=1 FL=1